MPEKVPKQICEIKVPKKNLENGQNGTLMLVNNPDKDVVKVGERNTQQRSSKHTYIQRLG